MTRAFCTIVSHSHLSQALVLADSLAAAGNPEPLHILVTDLAPDDARPAPGPVLLAPDELGQRFPRAMLHYFDAFELCNALKPFLVAHLLANGFERVVYLDADLWVVGSFAPVWSALDQHSLLLTPHHLQPPALGLPYIHEHEVADLGFLNGGFSAWRAGPDADRILAWLAERLPVLGFCDRYRCMFVDQKLLPLTLSYFPDATRVLRDPALNIAYWNSHERPVRRADGRWLVGDAPVVFFHLSGYKSSRPGRVCAYLTDEGDALLRAASPWLDELAADYGAALARHERAHRRRPYGFAEFEGEKLNPPLRALLFRHGKIDRASPRYWRIRAVESLRAGKRAFLARLRRPRPSAQP